MKIQILSTIFLPTFFGGYNGNTFAQQLRGGKEGVSTADTGEVVPAASDVNDIPGDNAIPLGANGGEEPMEVVIQTRDLTSTAALTSCEYEMQTKTFKTTWDGITWEWETQLSWCYQSTNGCLPDTFGINTAFQRFVKVPNSCRTGVSCSDRDDIGTGYCDRNDGLDSLDTLYCGVTGSFEGYKCNGVKPLVYSYFYHWTGDFYDWEEEIVESVCIELNEEVEGSNIDWKEGEKTFDEIKALFPGKGSTKEVNKQDYKLGQIDWERKVMSKPKGYLSHPNMAFQPTACQDIPGHKIKFFRYKVPNRRAFSVEHDGRKFIVWAPNSCRWFHDRCG